MKKLLITLTAFATFSFINAQEDDIRFGAKGGLNISNFAGDDADDFKSKVGFHFGAIVEIPVSDVFAVQPELIFSTQGSQFTLEDFDGFESFTFDTTFKLSYLNLPIMAKYYVAEGLSLQVGPQLGFLLDAKVKVEVEGTEVEDDAKEAFKGVDFGLNFGLGYQLEAGVFFDARYNLGLSNIADGEGSEDVDLKNSAFQISVGYKF